VPRAHALLLESVHASAGELLAARDIEVHLHAKAMGEADLIAALHELPKDVPSFVGIRSKTHITEKVMTAVPHLIGIGAFCIGTDQIDLAVARRRGVAVFNAPFSSTRSVAELVMAEVVMLSRQLYARCRAAHDGRWAKSASGAHEVRGKTLGIIGYGHIGSQVGILAEAFGMRVRYFDIDKKLPLGNVGSAPSMEDVLRDSDFLTLHVPDTDRTRGMIGAAELAQMKQGAYLLNLSRGKVVDIPALRRALDEGRLAGAAVDVYPKEPASTTETFVSELRGLDQVVLTPHIGGSTLEAQANIGEEVAAALARYLDVGATLGCVTLPHLDVVPPQRFEGVAGSRIINIHANVPGVLSRINQVVAESEVNIVGQALATNDDVGLLFIDVPLSAADPKAAALREGISALTTSVRTRLVAT
jgi:D-3-phosphoglycerate dehydrogenase